MKHKIGRLSGNFINRLAAAPFRVVALLLHALGLERWVKLRLPGSRQTVGLNQALIDRLPKYCNSITGARMDPINLIFLGDKRSIKELFEAAAWTGANPLAPWHLLWATGTSLRGKRHDRGPFSPLYINIGLPDLALQKLSIAANFKQRHHIRLWRTPELLPDGREIWVGAASFDSALKIQLSPPFVHHAIDPDLDAERERIVDELIKYGAVRHDRYTLNEPVLASANVRNASGNYYFTDGIAAALVVEVTT